MVVVVNFGGKLGSSMLLKIVKDDAKSLKCWGTYHVNKEKFAISEIYK